MTIRLLLTCSLVFAGVGVANAQTTAPLTIQQRMISADFNQVQGPTSQVFKQCIGAGRANEGLRADWQRQLTYAKQQCDFKYIRMHGLLSDDMGVYRENKAGNPIYNWQYIDELYDFLERIHVKPFVEFGFMPHDLASGSKTIFWWRANVTPPKDYGKWHDLIKALVTHWTQRYGEAEVKTWYFEVWNEPNLSGLFWTGNQQDYFKLYATTAQAIKEVSPDYRVGGPATAGGSWVPQFIQYCADNKVPVDFVSTHTYGVRQGFLDENGTQGTVLSRNPLAITSSMVNTRKQIASSPMPKLELHYTEWSSSYSPADPIHDNYQEASYILDKVKHAENSVDSMSYWTFTDIFEENGPQATPFHGGFGLINYEDINKPAFYAFQYLNKLGATELVNADDSSILTKDSHGNIEALLWDFTVTQPGNVNDQDYYNHALPSTLKERLTLKIADIPAGRYRMECSRIGYRSNDAFDTYLGLGAPSQLTREQVAYIKGVNSGGPYQTSSISLAAKATFSKDFDVRENDVFLVTLTKVK